MNTSVMRIWFCRHCGFATLRSPSGMPCVRCLKHGHELVTYADVTVR